MQRPYKPKIASSTLARRINFPQQRLYDTMSFKAKSPKTLRILRLAFEGITLDEIALSLEETFAAVNQVINRNMVSYINGRLSSSQLNDLRNGGSNESLSESLHLSQDLIATYKRLSGLKKITPKQVEPSLRRYRCQKCNRMFESTTSICPSCNDNSSRK